MGSPAHFSSELPERCLHLVETLLPEVKKTHAPGQAEQGPLTTTFLFAMAMPIITLPMERVKRYRERELKGEEGHLDDRGFSPELAAAIDDALGGGSFSKAPFYRDGHWRFHEHPYEAGMNLARSFPHDVAEALDRDEATNAAGAMPAEQWASCLRNALAHGGVTYLDAHGNHVVGARAEMMVFSSAKYPGRDTNVAPSRLRHLRITESAFLDFLRLWVGWLHSSKLSFDLAA